MFLYARVLYFAGGKNSSDRALLIDMLLWTIKHSPPAHVLLISGDSDFSVLLHKMRMLSYDVLLAAPNKMGMAPALVNAANRVWVWPDIAMGHNTRSSWSYSESKGKGSAVEADRFEGSSKSGVEDVGKDGPAKSSGAQCLPPIVVNKIMDIVHERPGISLGDISKELRNLSVNPRSFGFASFYHLLVAMKQLQTRFVDGAGMKDRVTFYLADESKEMASESRDRVGAEASKPQIEDSSEALEHDGSSAKERPNDGQIAGAQNPSSWRSWFASLFRNA